MPNGDALRDWLIGELVASLSSVFEMMTGEAVAIAPVSGVPPPEALAAPWLVWNQPFSGAPGAVWLTVSEPDYAAMGAHMLGAAGVEEADAATHKSTYLETLSQALSGLAQALSGKLKREVTASGGQESREAPGDGLQQWWRADIAIPDHPSAIYIGFEDSLVEELTEKPAEPEKLPAPALPPPSALPGTSQTFDILLDVELPVSVSFGRAQLQLKDVLKLTTGSIVELNRSITEPVEVIVNNCVIARGEVVVVEGNFGVRIQQVMSRQERLRTLA